MTSTVINDSQKFPHFIDSNQLVQELNDIRGGSERVIKKKNKTDHEDK